MGERGVEVKVGILVTVCVGLLVMFILLLGDFSMSAGTELFLDLETSAALKPGAPVKVAGVSAGKVARVDYRGGAYDEAVGRPVFVRVSLRIDDDKLATLRKDARFHVTTQGILGEKYVEIEPISPTGPLLKPGDVVVGEPPLRLEIMASNANKVLRSLAEIFRKNEKHLDDIIVNASATMKSVRRAAEHAETLLVAGGPKVAQALDKLLTIEDSVERLVGAANTAIGDGTALAQAIGNVSSLTAEVEGAVGPVVADVRASLARYQELADAGRAVIGEVGPKVASSLTAVNEVLGDVKTVTAGLKDGRGTIGALMSDREMYDDIREMMKDLKRHPWKFIWKE